MTLVIRNVSRQFAWGPMTLYLTLWCIFVMILFAEWILRHSRRESYQSEYITHKWIMKVTTNELKVWITEGSSKPPNKQNYLVLLSLWLWADMEGMTGRLKVLDFSDSLIIYVTERFSKVSCKVQTAQISDLIIKIRHWGPGEVLPWSSSTAFQK